MTNMLLLSMTCTVMLSAWCAASAYNQQPHHGYYRIKLVDVETGKGVPLVMLRTNNYVQMVSDSAGNIAFYEPGMMDTPVWFSVLTDGYELALNQGDNFYFYDAPYDSGVVLTPTADGSTIIYLSRKQVAQRLYRLTGAGLYRDSYLTNALEDIPATCKSPLLDAHSGVTGQDTVMTAVYKNKVIWMWGDTVCPISARQNNCNSYGMYTVGATSPVLTSSTTRTASCSKAQLPPDLHYYGVDSDKDTLDNGTHFPHMSPMAAFPPLNDNTWIADLIVLNRGEVTESLYANYYKNPGDGESTANGTTPITGICKWNDTSSSWFEIGDIWPTNNFLDGGHTIQLLGPNERHDGYVYFNSGYRVLAKEEYIIDYRSYEQFKDGKWVKPSSNSDIGGTGNDSGVNIASIEWNDYLQQYIMIAEGGIIRMGFSSNLTGPWNNLITVGTHSMSGTSCYNLIQLPHMDCDDSSVIHFACTYTSMWSDSIHTPDKPSTWTSCLFGLNNKVNCAPVTPRYEYNNLIYAVDLSSLKKYL